MNKCKYVAFGYNLLPATLSQHEPTPLSTTTP
ncbi:hypothetical protein J2X87_002527 [Pseudomonas synxantha]|uniref:Uncharacterized protein n=1 Tax=Pseudomonas synxantha TaxID=47883 RepID=A0ACC6JMH2_9PSED|nr:hypothetical protein [Pseudomonas synxantha]